MRAALGEPSLVLLSIGSPDPADGVGRRLDAYAQLLDEGRLDPRRTVLIHVAASGDEQNMDPLADHDRIDRQVGQINGAYARLGRPVVHYLRRELAPAELIAVYLAADVMIATPLHHGPVLAAKEFVATRTADTGRLVVSEFTGAATDLPEADVVNPHDIDAVKTTILLTASQARTTSPQMAAMRQRLELRDVHAWADTFLDRRRHRHPTGAQQPAGRSRTVNPGAGRPTSPPAATNPQLLSLLGAPWVRRTRPARTGRPSSNSPDSHCPASTPRLAVHAVQVSHRWLCVLRDARAVIVVEVDAYRGTATVIHASRQAGKPAVATYPDRDRRSGYYR